MKARLLVLLAVPVLLLACATILIRQDGARVGAVLTPELGSPPTIADVGSDRDLSGDGTGPGEILEARIGSFERVASAPDYEILEQTTDEREGARGALLVIDTRSRGQEDFTLITRDVKARYDDLDAVTLRFIDSETVLDYNGGAVIFNTTTGAYYAGYVYGPPNTEGYLVDAAE